MEYTREEKYAACTKFYNELANKLSETHQIVGSCNKDISSYLIPNGTDGDISYYGKPADSFRISDHWNWYSNLRKCSNKGYVQCYSVDVPFARQRVEEGKASKPRFAIQVAYYGKDNKYHHIFGDKFDRKTGKWSFVVADVDQVLASIYGAVNNG